jgi:hypothetical protein
MAKDSDNARSVRIAVEYRDEEAVREAVAARRGLEEVNEIGDTPLLIATGSGQFVIAEILIDGGANIWAHDQFGLTAGRSAELVAYPPGTQEGNARARVIEKLKARGFPFPAPTPAEVIALKTKSAWPPLQSSSGER